MRKAPGKEKEYGHIMQSMQESRRVCVSPSVCMPSSGSHTVSEYQT